MFYLEASTPIFYISPAAIVVPYWQQSSVVVSEITLDCSTSKNTGDCSTSETTLYYFTKRLRGTFFFGFLRQGFSVALEAVLELALVDQAGLELTEIRLPLPPECWD